MARPLGSVGTYARTPRSVTYTVALSADTARLLMTEAARRDLPPATLLADIVECVLGDRLLDAVLDDA